MCSIYRIHVWSIIWLVGDHRDVNTNDDRIQYLWLYRTTAMIKETLDILKVSVKYDLICSKIKSTKVLV